MYIPIADTCCFFYWHILLLYSMPPFSLRYISHQLVVVCAIITSISWLSPALSGYGMSSMYWISGDYVGVGLQVLLYQFLHANIAHILMNGLFLYQAWPEVETRMHRSRYIGFFVVNTLWVALCIYIFSPDSITIGISGWCSALLAYLFVDLYTTRHPMYTQIGIMLGINLAIGFSSGVSLSAHAAGTVCGLAWWYIGRK
jgi:hypothetical protein